MKLHCEKWNISVSFCNDYYWIGIGWWHGSRILFAWDHLYYNGNWFGCRLGPFFFSKGPY